MANSVTLNDVARLAGVHPGTVSRVLSRPELVNSQTREKVIKAVEETGYVPNLAARHLAGGKSATIAIIVPDIMNPFFAAIAHSVQYTARRSERLVLFADCNSSAMEEREAIISLARNVDGIIVCAPVSDPNELAKAALGVPVVFVNSEGGKNTSVVIDQEAIIKYAIEHLMVLGHTNIAVVSGPRSFWSTKIRNKVLSNLIKSRRELNISLLKAVEPNFEGGKSCAKEIRSLRVTAVAAFNDLQALGVIVGLTGFGVGVPNEVSVVGSDGLPIGEIMIPSLTSIVAPLNRIGEVALELMDKRIHGESELLVKVSPYLIPRGSTAPC